MIVVLHGEDIASSYDRLSKILENYKDHLKLQLGTKPTEEQIIQASLAQDLLDQKKVIIAEGFLAPLKKLPKMLSQIPSEAVVIFWEKSTLSPAKVAKLQKIAKIEHFKLSSQIFNFIDNLAPGSQIPLKVLPLLKEEESLLWQVQNRLFQMMLAANNVSLKEAIKISKRNIFDWQWARISTQTKRFNLKNLMAMYTASLKIDFLIKSGKTNLPAQTLVTALLLKYLR